MSPLAKAVYVPPCPNPGPEPMPAPQSPVVAITLSLAGLALLAVTLASLRPSLRRRSRRRRIRAERSARHGLPESSPNLPASAGSSSQGRFAESWRGGSALVAGQDDRGDV